MVRIFQNNCQQIAISQKFHLFGELNRPARLDDLTALRLYSILGIAISYFGSLRKMAYFAAARLAVESAGVVRKEV
ncbi:MAG: hypothetical protein WCE23_06270 [Candidatus Binatus sp.]